MLFRSLPDVPSPFGQRFQFQVVGVTFGIKQALCDTSSCANMSIVLPLEIDRGSYTTCTPSIVGINNMFAAGYCQVTVFNQKLVVDIRWKKTSLWNPEMDKGLVGKVLNMELSLKSGINFLIPVGGLDPTSSNQQCTISLFMTTGPSFVHKSYCAFPSFGDFVSNGLPSITFNPPSAAISADMNISFALGFQVREFESLYIGLPGFSGQSASQLSLSHPKFYGF